MNKNNKWLKAHLFRTFIIALVIILISCIVYLINIKYKYNLTPFNCVNGNFLSTWKLLHSTTTTITVYKIRNNVLKTYRSRNVARANVCIVFFKTKIYAYPVH